MKIIKNPLNMRLELSADPTKNRNCIVQVLNQDETPLLYSLVFGEGVVNDATSVVLFNAIQGFDISSFDYSIGLQFIGNFIHLFLTSTLLGVFVSLSLSLLNVLLSVENLSEASGFCSCKKLIPFTADWTSKCLCH